jgi:hypothetical protein
VSFSGSPLACLATPPLSPPPHRSEISDEVYVIGISVDVQHLRRREGVSFASGTDNVSFSRTDIRELVISIKGEANPYDPTWEIYFEERLGVKMVNNLKGRRQLLYLWKQQEGQCPLCRQKITKLTGWNNHHIVRRTDGGSNKADNRVLLHPNCHRKVHSQKLSVAKPRSERNVRKA